MPINLKSTICTISTDNKDQFQQHSALSGTLLLKKKQFQRAGLHFKDAACLKSDSFLTFNSSLQDAYPDFIPEVNHITEELITLLYQSFFQRI